MGYQSCLLASAFSNLELLLSTGDKCFGLGHFWPRPHMEYTLCTPAQTRLIIETGQVIRTCTRGGSGQVDPQDPLRLTLTLNPRDPY